MENKQLIIIVLAIILAGCIIAGGILLASNNNTQQENITNNTTVANATSESSSEVYVVWVEDLDLSDKAGYDCHVIITHYSDGTKSWNDAYGYHRVPEEQELVF